MNCSRDSIIVDGRHSMFSQFRSAVESFAAQPRSSSETPPDERASSTSSQPSAADNHSGPISPLSSGQLAESALSNLRKSLAANRAGPQAMTKSASLPTPGSDKPRQKLNLEERLRASLSAVDVSTTSNISPPIQPESSIEDSSLSPASIPLPESPIAPPVELPSSDEPSEAARDAAGSEATSTVDAPAGSGTMTSPEVDQKQASSSVVPVKLDETTDNATFLPSDTTNGEGEALNDDATGIQQDGEAASDGDEDDVSVHKPPSVSSKDTPGEKGDDLEDLEEPLPTGKEKSNVEALQIRLKEVEQRFSDVSTSFKRLQAEKLAADSVLRDMTPLESIQDATALKEWFESLNSKNEVFQEEIKRLNGKLEVQEDRIEELRETHKLSASSQVSQLDTLQSQLRETDALFQEAQKSVAKLEETVSQKEKEISSLKSDVERSNTIVKEEEEKRTKAISLLKSVRQKLVKAEKDKEDGLKELALLREREKANVEKEQAERRRFESEVEAVRAEKDKALASLRAQFEKDIAGLKERHEKEIAAMRGQFELDAITTKSAHNKEIASKNSHISTLETSLNSVTRDKNAFFEQLQLRQAETESAQSLLESIQHQNTELQYQLREANDRVNLLKEDLNEMQRDQELRAREPTTSAENIAQLLASTESKYEAKFAELKRINATLERERNESEAEWSRKLKERGGEVEELKRLLGNSAKSQEREEETVAELKVELQRKHEEVKALESQLADLSKACSRLESSNASTQAAANDLQSKIIILEKQIEESKTKDAQLRQTNKSLREELRKVQSSAALLERQRNPGVGYWTTRTSESSPSDTTATTPTPGSPRNGSPAPDSQSPKNEEEVNLEYLRNVILQFLEHKEMRPNLVRVLSIILHFTPQETRRLMAKV
ncbi:hypothetical protein NP233_g5956 [Leucocoprinus birnbaumii]|uniref:GRIP domain-containing protein n=1 Tax=Leucocoprinus birnbaumii TaxID=56174 RepID=A0AAD5VRY6_9AGAR|nr:hypothetical protein NP233_g5956 [Leucocoprinus birnbaumii]